MTQTKKMFKKSNATLWLVILITAIIITDQAIKIWVKTTFPLYDGINVCGWFQLYFIENKGMAFGMEMGSKIFLTLFRIAASIALIYYLYILIKKKYSTAFILCIGLILAGAVGNLIDSVIYGQIFSHSIGQVATLFPEEGGYAPLFHGKVVDMFYFPLITDSQGETIFFRPVFNFADAAVTVGVALILIFFRKDLDKSLDCKKKKQEDEKTN